MGTCCFGNQPSEKFVGTWTDNEHVKLTIAENGNIQYLKEVCFYLASFLFVNFYRMFFFS